MSAHGDAYESERLLLAEARARLAAAGIEEAAREAALLRRTAAAEGKAFADWLARRAAREPLSRIAGRREFWMHAFPLNRCTLDPRPESELLVECGLKACARLPRGAEVVEFGTGGGAVLLSLLAASPGTRGLGLERSAPALGLARAQARRMGVSGRVRFRRLDWRTLGGEQAGQAGRVPSILGARAWLALANPPYLTRAEVQASAAEVRDHDPHFALDGGFDGLGASRTLRLPLARALRRGGVALVEVAAARASATAAIFDGRGFRVVSQELDLSGKARVLVLRRT